MVFVDYSAVAIISLKYGKTEPPPRLTTGNQSYAHGRCDAMAIRTAVGTAIAKAVGTAVGTAVAMTAVGMAVANTRPLWDLRGTLALRHPQESILTNVPSSFHRG